MTIWAREHIRSGANCPSPTPAVISAPAHQPTAREAQWPGGTSEKSAASPSGDPAKRWRKAAVWARVQGESGRKVPSGQPVTMSSAQATAGANQLPASTSE